MGAVRTTQRLLIDRVLNDLSLQQREILRLQEQLSTGQIVNRPSDDALATRRAISAQAEISRNEQYLTNISTANPGLTQTDTSLMTTIDIIQRTRELTLQGASGTNSQLQRDQIALEVDQLLESMLSEANQLSNERYIFGGTVTLSPPFGLSDAQDQVLVSVAKVGATQNRLERSDSNIQDINLQLLAVISDNIDADFAETIVELNAQSNALQASLDASARVIQPSLLNFLQ